MIHLLALISALLILFAVFIYIFKENTKGIKPKDLKAKHYFKPLFYSLLLIGIMFSVLILLKMM